MFIFLPFYFFTFLLFTTFAPMKKLFIETYGCQMNVADSEVVASVMQMAGYELCEKIEEADAVFLNTCSVRDNAEQKIYHRLDELAALRTKREKESAGLIIGVLGCMAERVKEDLLENHHCNLVAGPDAYLSLPDLIAQAELGHKAINVELSTTETYRDVVPVITFATIALCLSPVDVSVVVMWKAFSEKFAIFVTVVSRKSHFWVRMSIAMD